MKRKPLPFKGVHLAVAFLTVGVACTVGGVWVMFGAACASVVLGLSLVALGLLMEV